MTGTRSEKTLSVCFISPKSYPLFNDSVTSVFGGAEVDAYLLATELAKDDRFAVSIIVADYGQARGEMREGVRIITGVDFRWSMLSNARQLWSAMKMSGADIFFLETASVGVPFASLYCRLKSRGWVYRMASSLESDGTYLARHPILGRMFIRALRRAGRVIAQNEADRRNLLALAGIDSEVIPNGQRIPPVAEKQPGEYILWAGRSEHVKRPDLFLALARRFPNERFVMICQKATGDTRYEDLKETAGGVKNVTFVERVAFRDMDQHFGEAKVLVNTSDSEGFPNAFIQACKNSTAILSLNANPDDFLHRYDCGICCEGDFERAVDSLRRILADGSYMRLGANGRKYAEGRHSISTVIERYKEVFTTVGTADG